MAESQETESAETETGSETKSRVSATEYARGYYERNKLTIAARKKQRYENDPAYRQAILKRRKAQRGREKKERHKAMAKKVPRSQRPPKRMRIKLGDTDETAVTNMFSRGQLAYQLGLSTQTVNKWERIGVIPPAMYRSKGHHRLYTEAQVETMCGIYQRYRKPDRPWRITDKFITAMHAALAGLNYGLYLEEDEDDD